MLGATPLRIRVAHTRIRHVRRLVFVNIGSVVCRIMACAIVGCHTNKKKNRGISFHRVKRKDEEWTGQMVKLVNRCDSSFNVENAEICSLHFEAHCFKKGRNEFSRILLPRSLPTLALPKKSIETAKPQRRKRPKERSAAVDHVESEIAEIAEADVAFDGSSQPPPLLQQVAASSRAEWLKRERDDTLDLLYIFDMQIVKCIRVPKDQGPHPDVLLYVGGLRYSTLISPVMLDDVFSVMDRVNICEGIRDDQYLSMTGRTFFTNTKMDSDGNIKSALRSLQCQGGTTRGSICSSCQRVQRILRKRLQREKPVPAARAPLYKLSKQKLMRALKVQREATKKLQYQLAKCNKIISKNSVQIQSSVHDGLIKIMKSNKNIEDLKPLTKLFWQQQMKFLNTEGSSHRWHPMMIRLALLIHSQSPAAYRALRETGILTLPGESTLREYTNLTNPSQGFNPEVIEELSKMAKGLEEKDRYVVLMHDEMSIKSDLVYSERSGDIIGFSFDDEQRLANHVLVLMVVGVTVDIKFSIGYFGSTSAKSSLLYYLLWKAIFLLERKCGLKVIASVSDKAAPNLKLVSMCGGHATENMYAADGRSLFFLSDVPHLIKTLRNNLLNSGSAKKSRYMWKDGKHLLWQHVRDLFNKDQQGQLRSTKLTPAHIQLTSYSLMNVRLAAQVMSESVGKLLQASGGDEVQETATFILLVDRFFDTLNARSESESYRKRKKDLMPFTSIDDTRFEFLLEFVKYFDDWKAAINARQGFSAEERQRMFLSQQTHKGLVITVRSAIGLIQYLLNSGVKKVPTNVFTQDPLEAYFGIHRGLGRRCENPTLYAFGYQENKLRIQRSVSAALRPKGNVRLGKRRLQVTDSPLKRRHITTKE